MQASVAAAQQQQHFSRLAASTNGTGAGQSMTHAPDRGSNFSGPGPNEHGNAEEKRVLDAVAQLLHPSTRESALLELSKKREQFPQLALILWHSFGEQSFQTLW